MSDLYEPDHGGLGKLVVDFVREMLPSDAIHDALGSDDRSSWRERYWSDPVAFARDHFRWPRDTKTGRVQWLTHYQQDILKDLQAYKRVAAWGPRGNGKTRCAAVAAWHFILTRDGFVDWKMPITAGGYRQLEEYLFPEIRSLSRMIRWDKVGRRPFANRTELMKLTIEGETGRAFGAACTRPDLIEGAHAPQIFYILDESKSISDGVFDAIEGMAAAAGLGDREMYILAISTPGPRNGRFFQICLKDKPGFEDWKSRPITAEEAIRAGRMSVKWAKQRAEQWGTNSAIFKCHVLGEFADVAADGVIPYFWAEEAQNRSLDEATGPEGDDGAKRVLMSVDVASGGTNESVISIRRGWAITELIAFQSNDTMKVVERVQDVARYVKPQMIVIDAVGVGAGPYDRLRELGLPMVPFHGGESATERDSSGEIVFLNRRAWAWWRMRELLHPYGPVKLSLPNDPILLTQLAMPTYSKTQHDMLKIESKTEIERRMRKLNPHTTDSCSPDRADSVVMAFSDVGFSTFEEAFAASGLHTNLSLARLPGVPGVDPQQALREQKELLRKAQEQVEAQRATAIEERKRKARPEAVQVEELMFCGLRRNADFWNQ